MDKYEEKKTLKVEDIKDIMGIGYNAAYRLVKNHEQYNFEVYQIGRQYIIPKESFFKSFSLN